MLYSSNIFTKVGWNPRLGSAVSGATNWLTTFGGLYLLGSNNHLLTLLILYLY